jgi:L-lysine exporter family protein LysE/ArgO
MQSDKPHVNEEHGTGGNVIVLNGPSVAGKYLDTVVLLGSVAAREGGRGAPLFGVGAAVANCAWFSSLGFGARYLAPLFARPLAWRLLDGAIGLVMLALAGSLLV